ncbi:MAG: hypothetical protein K0U01_04425 [Betaproteobacteria bacterium]|nr:hypothetical protein [Betaproteobacteria bacterium]
MNKEISIFLENEKNTSELGLKLSKILSPGLLFFLKGDLGVGKNTSCKVNIFWPGLQR